MDQQETPVVAAALPPQKRSASLIVALILGLVLVALLGAWVMMESDNMRVEGMATTTDTVMIDNEGGVPETSDLEAEFNAGGDSQIDEDMQQLDRELQVN